MLLETNQLLLPINCPVRTRSPFVTTASAGAPMCCDKGIVTVSGRGMVSMGQSRLILLSDG